MRLVSFATECNEAGPGRRSCGLFRRIRPWICSAASGSDRFRARRSDTLERFSAGRGWIVDGAPVRVVMTHGETGMPVDFLHRDAPADRAAPIANRSRSAGPLRHGRMPHRGRELRFLCPLPSGATSADGRFGFVGRTDSAADRLTCLPAFGIHTSGSRSVTAQVISCLTIRQAETTITSVSTRKRFVTAQVKLRS